MPTTPPQPTATLTTTLICALSALFLTALIGCESDGSGAGADGRPRDIRGRVLPLPPPPPEVPPARAVTVDVSSRSAARAEVLAAARSSDEVLRANAIEAMREAGGAGYAGQIVDALKDGQPVVRFAAAMAAGELKLAEAKPSLLRMVNDHDLSVQVAVRFALHRLGYTRHSHDLEKTAVNYDPAVRGSTALVLGMLGEPSALKVLKVMRNDGHAAVRQQAIEAAWRLGDERARNELVALSVSKRPDDRMIALMALAGRHDQRVRQHVRSALTTEYEEVNLVAARAMGLLGRDEGYGVAQKGARSNDPRHRWLAARAFGAIGRADAQGTLTALLKDNNPTVRLSAAAALLQVAQRQGQLSRAE
jgi:HEAT repeat protein